MAGARTGYKAGRRLFMPDSRLSRRSEALHGRSCPCFSTTWRATLSGLGRLDESGKYTGAMNTTTWFVESYIVRAETIIMQSYSMLSNSGNWVCITLDNIGEEWRTLGPTKWQKVPMFAIRVST